MKLAARIDRPALRLVRLSFRPPIPQFGGRARARSIRGAPVTSRGGSVAPPIVAPNALGTKSVALVT